MLFRRAMMPVLLTAAMMLVSGCGESPAPVVTEEEEPVVEGPIAGDADAVLGEASEGFLSVMDEMPEAAPGQWITFQSDTEEGEFSIAVLRSEEVEGISCLWYQISMEDVVFQVLVDQVMFDTLKDDMRVFLEEMGDDPEAWLSANMAEGDFGNLFMPEDDPERLLTFVRSIKMMRIKSEDQIIAIDMTGVAELVEEELANNPDMLSQAGGISAEPDSSFQEFAARVQEAEFLLEHSEQLVANENLDCLVLTITHPEEGSIALTFSNALPLIPIAGATVTPIDPTGEPRRVFVSGFGFDGAEDLMPEPATQTIPAAMMLRSLMQQAPAQP